MTSVPPVPPPPPEPPPPEKDGGNAVGRQPADPAGRRSSQVPPPPPPRSQPLPVRPMPAIGQVRSGIGSAQTRWRGSLPEIDTSPKAIDDEPTTSEQLPHGDEEDSEETAEDIVGRSAPSWLLSLVIHLIVLLVLALIGLPAGKGITSLVLEFGISETQVDDALDFDVFSIESESIDEFSDVPTETLTEVEIQNVFDSVVEKEEVVIKDDLLGKQFDIAPPMFSGRTGAMRKALMAIYGATEETEEAVKLGLEWLKRQQHKDGYWSMVRPYSNGATSENRTAATAMAILAYAGDGSTHLSGHYQEQVSKGVRYLVAQQDRGGYMVGRRGGNQNTYAQAQATIALCELYGMTKDSWLREYAQQAINYAMKAQGPNGGWRYRPGEPGDTSVTGWYVMAVQSARSAGLDVNESKVRHISDFLDSVRVKPPSEDYEFEGYAYQPGRSIGSPAMTAEAILCRQYLGWSRNMRQHRNGINQLRQDAPFDLNYHNVYYWYYATQVFHHYGGVAWTEWNDQIKVKLPALQIKQGAERGSWAPQRDEWRVGGRLYTTCLCIYCLEVYYRHLPLYEHEVPKN